MSQDHTSHGVELQQTEQELFDSFLNLDDDHNYDDVWQAEPSYQFAHLGGFTETTPNNETFQRTQPYHGQRRALDLSSQLPLDSWQPHPLLPQSNIPARGSKSRKALPRKRSTYFTPRAQRYSTPVSIPNVSSSQTYSNNSPAQLDPLQRWRNSPPEHEPAAISAIHRALQDTPAPPSDRTIPWSPTVQPRSTSAPILSSPFHTYRQSSSRASSESGISESSQLSTISTKSHNRARLHARRTVKAKVEKPDKDTRRFKCTFCCDDFRTKYDWARHERSLHLDVKEWRCCPHGSMVFSQTTNRIHCAYCNALDPTLSHLEAHNYAICDDPEHPTTFHRKDHLVQHLRLAHHLESLPLIEDWKIDTVTLTCRCGFCDTRLSNWDERAAYLSEHFRQGLTMANWRGDHDFDAHITVKIRNAIPPYIIADESRAIVPFKAGDARTQDHFNQFSHNVGAMSLGQQVAAQIEDQGATFNDSPVYCFTQEEDQAYGQSSVSADPSGYLEILTRHLGRFAREQMVQGIVPTDEMFQNEARKLIYDGDAGGWDTTVADNEYWLASFKAQFGTNG